MPMTQRLQTALYHSRKRNRSLRAVPHLHRTHAIALGDSQVPAFDAASFTRPITLAAKIEHTATLGWLFDYNAQLGLKRDEVGKLDVYANGVSVGQVDTPDSGNWLVVLSVVPGGGGVRLWNQDRLMFASDSVSFTGSAWGLAGAPLNAQMDLLSSLSAYVAQLPQHYLQLVTAQPPIDDDLEFLTRSTALHWLVDAYPWLYNRG